jgi:hypothetical protein
LYLTQNGKENKQNLLREGKREASQINIEKNRKENQFT